MHLVDVSWFWVPCTLSADIRVLENTHAEHPHTMPHLSLGWKCEWFHFKWRGSGRLGCSIRSQVYLRSTGLIDRGVLLCKADGLHETC